MSRKLDYTLRLGSVLRTIAPFGRYVLEVAVLVKYTRTYGRSLLGCKKTVTSSEPPKPGQPRESEREKETVARDLERKERRTDPQDCESLF